MQNQIYHPSYHIVLRVHDDDLAQQVRRYIDDENETGDKIEIKPRRSSESQLAESEKNQHGKHQNEYIFAFKGLEYPAVLLTLPTPVEIHKTVDQKLLSKTADICQMLHVFHEQDEKSSYLRNYCLNDDLMVDGITPPTVDIVHRRYEKTRSNEEYLPYQIRTVSEDIKNLNPTGEQTIVSEEVVDFEDYMFDPESGDGKKLVFTSDLDIHSEAGKLLLLHPEILVSEEDREEDDLERVAKSSSHQSDKPEEQESSSEMKQSESLSIVLNRNTSMEAIEEENVESDSDYEERRDEADEAEHFDDVGQEEMEVSDQEEDGDKWLDEEEDV